MTPFCQLYKCPLEAEPHLRADCAHLRMTAAQYGRIIILGGEPGEFSPRFDLPSDYVAGWAKGVYYGIDAEGRASS